MQRLLAQAVDAEAAEWIDRHAEAVDDAGRRQGVRNGHHPSPTILTGVGPVEVTQVRVRDRRIVGTDAYGQAMDAANRPIEQLCSSILPPYLRKTKAVKELIPWLYLKGVSTVDYREALQALVGPQALGLSATTITRLIGAWQQDYQAWRRRPLEDKQYAYVWADGIVNNFDIDWFVRALTDTDGFRSAQPGCHPLRGDINRDGSLTNADIDAFVDALTRS